MRSCVRVTLTEVCGKQAAIGNDQTSCGVRDVESREDDGRGALGEVPSDQGEEPCRTVSRNRNQGWGGRDRALTWQKTCQIIRCSSGEGASQLLLGQQGRRLAQVGSWLRLTLPQGPVVRWNSQRHSQAASSATLALANFASYQPLHLPVPSFPVLNKGHVTSQRGYFRPGKPRKFFHGSGAGTLVFEESFVPLS